MLKRELLFELQYRQPRLRRRFELRLQQLQQCLRLLPLPDPWFGMHLSHRTILQVIKNLIAQSTKVIELHFVFSGVCLERTGNTLKCSRCIFLIIFHQSEPKGIIFLLFAASVVPHKAVALEKSALSCCLVFRAVLARIAEIFC